MKDIFKKIANLVVEVPETPSAPGSLPSAPAGGWDSEPKVRRTIADLVRDAPGPNLEDVHVPVPAPAPEPEPEPVTAAPTATVAAAGPLFDEQGKVDVQAIYAKAALPSSPFTAEQAYDMLQGLPAEMPEAVRKQSAMVMLSAMGKTLGVTPETIVTDAARKAAALSSFVDGMTKQSEAYVAKVQSEIQELEAKIAQNRQAIETAHKRIEDLRASTEAEAQRLAVAAEFFSTTQPG